MGAGLTDRIACHECDLLLRVPHVPVGGAALCARCGCTLFRDKPESIDHTLAFTVAGAVLFVVANSFPFLSVHMQGQETQTTLATGVFDLYEQGYWELAGLVALTAVVAPALQLTCFLYILLPLRLGRVPALLRPAFRLVRRIQPWSMMEVFMLGILVSVVKMQDLAEIVPGLAIYAFALLILVLAAAGASLDPRRIWMRAEELA